MEKMRNHPKHSHGFSMLELCVSLAVMLVVAAISVPYFLRGMNEYKLSNAAMNVSSLIQRTRYEAIKRNRRMVCYQTIAGATITVWVDLNGTGALAPNDPQYVYPQSVFNAAPGGTVPGPASMGFPNAQIPAGSIAFDYRGAVDFTGVPGGPTIWAVYFTFNNDPTYEYKAISVEPLGRSKVWTAASKSAWHSP